MLTFADDMVRMVDARAAGLTPADIRSLAAIFRTSTRHEIAFWDASYLLTQWPDAAKAQPIERKA
jgi:thiaminase